MCFSSFAADIIHICVPTDPDIPTEPMLPEDRFNEIRKSSQIELRFVSACSPVDSSLLIVSPVSQCSSAASVSPPVEEITEYPDFVETNQISGAGNMLKTLDPILITIIAMSALGVFLGAICGVVLYCACSHGGMSDRNLSALENYNFELVDGVKLKKDKLTVQSSYSEA